MSEQSKLSIFTVLLPPIRARLASEGADGPIRKCGLGDQILLVADHPFTIDLLACKTITADVDLVIPTEKPEIVPPAGAEGAANLDLLGDLDADDEGDLTQPPEGDPPPDLMDLNQASAEQLQSLKYVGKAIAKRIVDARPLASWAHFQEATDLREEQIVELQSVAVI
jgi:Helix-hairpin-helix motif